MTNENSRYHCSASGEHIKVSIRARGLMQALREKTTSMACVLMENSLNVVDWTRISLARRDIVAYIAEIEEKNAALSEELLRLKRATQNKPTKVLPMVNWGQVKLMTVDQLLACGRALLSELTRRQEESKCLAAGVISYADLSPEPAAQPAPAPRVPIAWYWDNGFDSRCYSWGAKQPQDMAGRAWEPLYSA